MESILGGLIGFIAGYLLSIFFKNYTPPSKSVEKRFEDYAKFAREADDFTAKMLQESEDRKFEFNVIKEANEAFNEYVESKPLFFDGKWQKIGRIIIANPYRGFYLVHHEPTAKYINADFGKMVREKYLELKTQYDKDNGSNI